MRDLRATPDPVAFCRLDRLSTGAFNAKAQGPKAAKSFFLPGVLATLQCKPREFRILGKILLVLRFLRLLL